MASDVFVTESADAYAGFNLTRWPVYASKGDLLRDLQKCPPSAALAEVMFRLSNTDPTGWTASEGDRIAGMA